MHLFTLKEMLSIAVQSYLVLKLLIVGNNVQSLHFLCIVH